MKIFVIFFAVFAVLIFAAGRIPDKDNKSISFLLMGIDSRSFAESNGVRSDTIMLFNVDRSTGVISIISIPRDTRTAIEGRKNKEKINHSFAYGGPELTVNTVSKLLGIDLEYYIVADYQMVKEYVDLVGGVEFDVPMDMTYSDPYADPPLEINLKAGSQVLDGDKALQYLRYRKGYKNADLGRIEAQQSFLKSLIKETAKPGIIFKIPGIYKIYRNSINTNIPMMKMGLYGVSLFKYDLDAINSNTLPGTTKNIDGISYFINSDEQTRDLIDQTLLDEGSQNQ
jgi:LCP family protein required for cell wall assembly